MFSIRALGLAALICGAGALIGSSARAQFVYGGGRDGNIYEIDLAAKTTAVLISTGFTGLSGTGVADGLANDTTRNNLFYFDPNSNLQVLGQGLGARQVASAAQLGTGGLQPQNAAFWNNNLWFFSRESNVLNQVSFTYPVDNTPVFDSITQFTLANVPNAPGNNGFDLNNFGDIAINGGADSPGRLFAATSNGTTGRLFSLELASLNESTINTSYINRDLDGLSVGDLQLVFTSDFAQLLGNGNNGDWVRVNRMNGNLVTQFSPPFITTGGGGSLPNSANFTDLSSTVALTQIQVPGPLPLMGVAAAFGWSRKLRKRVNSSFQLGQPGS
jgi:hypothetical protein